MPVEVCVSWKKGSFLPPVYEKSKQKERMISTHDINPFKSRDILDPIYLTIKKSVDINYRY